jgi:hypothetical protein
MANQGVETLSEVLAIRQGQIDKLDGIIKKRVNTAKVVSLKKVS